MRDIFLWWIGIEAANQRLLASVQAAIEEALDVPVRLWSGRERPEHAYDPRRQQYSSTEILRWLVERRPEPAHRILAVTDVDLFIPILTFVFGEAQFGGRAAVASTARLAPDGGRRNALLADRLAKECVHELGHTFRLLHCTDPRCVMARSVTVINIDYKHLAPCQGCWSRYRELGQEEDEQARQQGMGTG